MKDFIESNPWPAAVVSLGVLVFFGWIAYLLMKD